MILGRVTCDAKRATAFIFSAVFPRFGRDSMETARSSKLTRQFAQRSCASCAEDRIDTLGCCENLATHMNIENIESHLMRRHNTEGTTQYGATLTEHLVKYVKIAFTRWLR